MPSETSVEKRMFIGAEIFSTQRRKGDIGKHLSSFIRLKTFKYFFTLILLAFVIDWTEDYMIPNQ